MLCSAACGSQTASHAPALERTFNIDWHDSATTVTVHYATSRIRFHAGTWSADISVQNDSGKPLYEAVWLPDSTGLSWNGPALVYSGLDVLGERRLIYVPANHETPAIPFPLRDGATWRGTVSGKVPVTPPLPKSDDIWVRYPVFGVGQVWDGYTVTSAVQWISTQAVQL